jgi:hypothetical protein
MLFFPGRRNMQGAPDWRAENKRRHDHDLTMAFGMSTCALYFAVRGSSSAVQAITDLQ